MLQKLRAFQKPNINYLLIPLCLLAGVWVLWAFTGLWPTASNVYNSYALQANAWLRGHLYLSNGDYYASYLELAVYKGHYYVSFPPFPSVLLLPFVAILGTHTPDHLLAVLSLLTAGFYGIRLYQKFSLEKEDLTFWVLFPLLACNTVYTSFNGWVWFFAQNLAFTFTFMSFYYARCKRPGWALLFWAFAIGCRPLQILYLPLLAFIYVQELRKENPAISMKELWHHNVTSKWFCAIPMAMVAIFYMVLNYARFGNITQFGHDYLPEFTESTYGQFSIHYILPNIKRMLRLPHIKGTDSHLNFYYFDGFAFWLISPIFILLFIVLIRNFVKEENRIFSMLLIATFTLHFLGIVMHKTLGGSHFGNRYMNDLIPAAFYALLMCMPDGKWLKKIATPLFILGMTLNFVGAAIVYNLWYEF